MRRLVPFLALLCAAVPLDAQAPDSARFTRASATGTAADARAAARARSREREARQRKLDYVPAVRFTDARRRAVKERSQGAPVHVAADKETSYTLVVRSDTSQVEQHARWDDLIMVRAGRGVISFGRRAEGRRMLAPGEYRGGRLVEAYQLRLAPGDVARVPAGVPHAFWPEGTEPFEYMVVKVRRPARRLDPE